MTTHLSIDKETHGAPVIWLTGLPRSGKTSISKALEILLKENKHPVIRLDGDELRRGLCSDLGYSMADRSENIRRASYVAKLCSDAGFITIAALITPLAADRTKLRTLLTNRFIEVFCDCPLDVCQARDKSGQYQKAVTGELSNFTGISSPYKPPTNPEVRLDTNHLSIEQSVEQIYQYLIGCLS